MKENIANHQNLLSVFAILIKYGIITNKEITDWADSILASEAASDYAFIEISTSTSTYDLIKILEKNAMNKNPEMVCRAILGIVYHLLTKQLIAFKDSLKVVSEISYEEKLTEDEQFLLYGYSESSSYELQGVYESFRLYRENFFEFLSLYKNFTLTNHREWSSIHETLLTELSEKLEMVKGNYPY
ncbi:hypothetical protein [uncultured Chryseobacterium sp.]|uniref:hypothetical protein n=1 Tax=uncultured Chryseobacterium sp. TaxID=259322 RepID=UPI0025F28DDB|nr:hypothetical protein [uncultured Chryseobacterium sp.]